MKKIISFLLLVTLQPYLVGGWFGVSDEVKKEYAQEFYDAEKNKDKKRIEQVIKEGKKKGVGNEPKQRAAALEYALDNKDDLITITKLAIRQQQDDTREIKNKIDDVKNSVETAALCQMLFTTVLTTAGVCAAIYYFVSSGEFAKATTGGIGSQLKGGVQSLFSNGPH